MPTSPLKRQSGGGGRLRRLLASVRPTACTGPLPVQTGFPTSIADIVVKHHGRLKIPRRRHRDPGAPIPPPTAAAQPAPVSHQSSELLVAYDAAAPAPAPVTARPGRGASFSIRPGVLAAGGAVALALLVIWSKQLVAAATLVSVALSWIESGRNVRVLRGHVSPIREAAESPSPSCGESGSNDGGSDAASLWSADDTSDLGCGDTSSSAVDNPKRKQGRRSLRKLLASKLRNGKTPRGTDSRHGGEHERPETPRLHAEAAAAAAPGPAEATSPEAIADDEGCESHRRRGGAIPLPALVPIILAGLVAGKLPALALALAVLCPTFSSSVERVPVPASGRPSPRLAARQDST